MSTFNPAIKRLTQTKRTLKWPGNVYVLICPKSKNNSITFTHWGCRCYSKRTFPWHQCSEWCILFWKMQQYFFFSQSPVPPHMWWEHLEDIFFWLLEGLADSTMELIDSRCVGAQWKSEAFFYLSLWNIGRLIHISVHKIQHNHISLLIWLSEFLRYYHWWLWPKSILVFNCTRYSKNVISVFLMTKVFCRSRLWASVNICY